MPNVTFEFSFHEIDSSESLSRLAQSIGTSLINNTIDIPAENGKGIIKKISMEEGLMMRVFDCHLNKPLFIKKTADTVSSDRVFHIAYLLNPETLLIKVPGQAKPISLRGGMNILFVSNDIDIEAEIETRSAFHAVDISFTASWLQRTFADADERLQDFIGQIIKSNSPSIFFETTNADEFRTLSILHSTAISATKDSLRVKAAALSLLSGFYNKMLGKSFMTALGSKLFYQDKMIEVEKLLKNNLQQKFPGIDCIAKKVVMSESTLKRHFKIMFGKTINEYYLELKMDHAKRIMLDKSLSVNEVATLLEYEKPSNFILMFKRYHGFSPGSLRRKIV